HASRDHGALCASLPRRRTRGRERGRLFDGRVDRQARREGTQAAQSHPRRQAMSAKLPRWLPRDQRGREALKRWTLERLAETRPEIPKQSVTGLLAQVAAEHGNFQPVLALAKARLGLDLKPYLRPRKRQRGEYQRHARPWALARAAEDVRRTRTIWRAAF